jgi:radical SAM enzyme (TIGR01210 family)
MRSASVYPPSPAARDAFVLARRGARPRHDPWRHQGVLVEDERAADGRIAEVATVFLTGRECPWRCAMCDLWQHTLEQDTPRGALVHQLDDAVRELGERNRMPAAVKLYNAGSFFDSRAVPEADYDGLARRLVGFDRVIVESHPALVGARVGRFLAALSKAAGSRRAPRLEVAMGLETAHPAALEQLGKRFTLDQFAAAAGRLRAAEVDLRVFVLIGVPFVPAGQQADWTAASIAYAFACGASAVSLIPTRAGNGTIEALAAEGLFVPPTVPALEAALEAALPRQEGRVFADLWDLQRFSSCAACFAARRERLRVMNLEQRPVRRIECGRCGTAAA